MQREGVDYSETFSPIVKYDFLRVLLAIITEENLEVVQFDVRIAFLHRFLNKDVRMEIPMGLEVNKDREKVVCLLKKALYRLKQAPRYWNLKIASVLKRFNLRETNRE